MTKEEALNKAASYCSLSEKCEQDVRQKLIKWEVDPSFINHIIEHLYKENFLNEDRYARAYVKDKFRFNKWGKIKISAMLKSKGISSNTINTALDEINQTEYLNTIEEIINSKLKNLKYSNTYQRNGKLIQYAASKGFEPDLVLNIIKDNYNSASKTSIN